MSKKENILKVATRLFAVKGFDGTSVRKIAEEAGLSVAGMFHYIPSKEEILNEIMIGFMDEGIKKLMKIYNSDMSPIEKVAEVCTFYVKYYAGHKNQLTILVSEGKSLSLEHRQVFIDKQRIYVNALTRLFNDLTKEGLLKPIDPSILAFIFFGMVHWTHSWYKPKGEIGPEELGSVVSEVFLRGILKYREKTELNE
jgi:AcrR family transcriptional regulator